MLKLKLNKKHVLYVQKIKNKNLLKQNVVIIYVYNVIKNQLNIKNKMNVPNVDKKIGLFQLIINSIKNILNIKDNNND